MKTKGNKAKINIVTLGCSKNIVDSEVLMGQLRGNKIDVSHESEKLDFGTVIINTCGFIDNAKQESIDTILKYVELKEKGDIEKVYVTGCLSQRYKSDLEKEIPNVDAYFGTNDLVRILKTVGADYKHELIGERLITTPSHYAYFKIAEGCNRPCSFCAIPIMRGGHVSKTIEDLVKEAKHLAKNGTKELILIAQDLTYYGLDIYNDRKLGDLLKHLSDIEGIEWIRMQYAYPSQFPMDVLDVMNERSNICKYLDMPLQHISDNMLKSMRRGITKRRTIELVEQIRAKVPNIALRTTMIAGYPGETEQDVAELIEFVEQSKFDRLGVFTYSHEENTHAHTLNDTLTSEEKQSRADRVMEVQQDISLQLNQAKVGQTFKVMIYRKEKDYFIGRTEFDSPEVDNEVLLSAKDQYLSVGSFVQAKISKATEFDLYGDVIS